MNEIGAALRLVLDDAEFSGGKMSISPSSGRMSRAEAVARQRASATRLW